MKWNVLLGGAALALVVPSLCLAGDAARGQHVFKAKCAACHTAEAGGANKVGPGLFGVMARGAGRAAGFRYSAGFMQAVDKGLRWDESSLDQYLYNPSALLIQQAGSAAAKSSKTFRLPQAEDRADVIAFLATLK
ncbi:MAG: cytochrome c [Pseudomonadota bacterium]|nr:cytochrome c [Pseudomonadota bacterium]